MPSLADALPTPTGGDGASSVLPRRPDSGSTGGGLLAGGVVAVLAITAFVVVIVVVMSHLSEPKDAVSVITASGAVITGLTGAFFGVNVAHRAQGSLDTVQQTVQATTHGAQQASEDARRSNAATVAVVSALDMNNPDHLRAYNEAMRIMGA